MCYLLNMNAFWIKLVEQEIKEKESVFKFWSGVDVWIERPHLVNRKLLGNEILHTFTIPHSRLKSKSCMDFNEDVFQHYVKDVFASQELNQYLNMEIDSDQELKKDDDKTVLVTFRKLIPRNLDKFTEVLETVIRDKKNNTVTFWPKESDVHSSTITPTFPYRIKLEDNRIFVQIFEKNLQSNVTVQASKDWLKNSVFPKIIKWCCCLPTTTILTSLNLVSPKIYSMNYNYLKKKYGKKYVEIWPECSDPLKYVYEDIAIAAYLITLWKREREDLNLSSKQTFVELGCGNGLLVNILASEGYVGIGIDVRKRKIWDLYEKNIALIEKAIEPSDYNIFPSYDWLIGNHSDELTPWIPVIAARSSYKMRIFLLPCCAYSFNSKYERGSQGKTQYQSYLSFIHLLCECMGFNVHKDKLRIPSTKRICFVCTSRNYNEEDERHVDIKRQEFIETHSRKVEKISKCILKCESTEYNAEKQTNISNNSTVSKESNWVENFKPREQVELVRNCSQLDRKFLDNTVLTVANLLLKTENYISFERGTETILWNSGGKIHLSKLIELLDPSILKCLKNQSGGFQTFLRNHKNVFQIINGDVQLTVPNKEMPLNTKQASKRNRHLKKKQYCFREKPCFFFFHHPQGCLLEACDCKFCHKVQK